MSTRKINKPRRIKDSTLFLIIVIAIVFGNYTLSKYSSKTSAETSINVARFSVQVNGKDVKENEQFEILLNTQNNVNNNKIIPDTEGYFEIEINPTGTQVGLEYQIEFNLPVINGKEVIDLTKYTIDDGNTFNDITEENIVKGEINLGESNKELSEEDKINLKIYWEWNEDITNPVFSQPNIKITSIIKQKI